jgi:hypothetical protein
VESNEAKPQDVDAQLRAESQRLLAEMENLIGRARLLILEQRGLVAAPVNTLGDVLYRDCSAAARLPEREWAALVESMTAGDPLSLQALYERTHGIVSTLTAHLTGDPKAAEVRTLEFFHDLPRLGAGYDPRSGSVLAWIMNQARAAALEPRREAATRSEPLLPAAPGWSEPDWEDAAPGIRVKMLSTDAERDIVSMLVRLVPGGEYPAHTHAGVEELHLLEGELWIDERKLYPGDYNRAEPGTGDKRVWSETGCMCLLVTSARDILS